MPDFIPYSEKQEILPVDVWEGGNMLDLDCETVKVVAKTLRQIVSRLLQVDKSRRFNADDFDFLVYDDPQPNAGFISANKTRNKRNVIIVSTGITGLCKTEEELAGILAHELGHYTYYQLYGANQNTVIQERFSDLHALDLMIAGGYDPAAYSRVCEKMDQMDGESDKYSFLSVLVDVHGSGASRKEDVDAYLTKLHIERGDFKLSAPTGLYDNMVRVLNNHTDRYKTYWRQLLENKFPKIIKNPEYKPPIKFVLDLILSELKSGGLKNRQRIHEVWYYLANHEVLFKPEIESTQNFVEQLIDLYHKDANVHSLLKSSDFLIICKVLIKNFRGGKKFNVFAPIDQRLAQINEFMTTRDPERFKELVDILIDERFYGFSMKSLKDIFGRPQSFKMPSAIMAKGKIMPTDWLLKTAREISLDTYRQVLLIIENIGFDCDYEWLTDGDMKFAGKIIAVGKEEVKEKLDELFYENRNKENYQRNQNDFSDFMFVIDVFYDFDQGKISATEAVTRLYQYGKKRRKETNTRYDKDSFLYWLNRQIVLLDYRKSNPFLEFELQELNNSAAFAEFYIKPFLIMLKKVIQEKDPKSANRIRTDNPPVGKTWLEYLQYVSEKYIGLKEEVYIRKQSKDGDTVYKGKMYDVVRHFKRKLGFQYMGSALWNVNVGPVIEHISGVRTAKLQSVLLKFINTAVKEHAYSAQDAASVLNTMFEKHDHSGQWERISENKTVNLIVEQEKQEYINLQAPVFEDFSVYASKEQWAERVSFLKRDALSEEIEHKTDLHKIYRLLSAYGVVAHNEQELLDLLSKPVPTVNPGISILEERLKEFILVYYMHNNKPITDIYPFLFAILSDRVPDFSNVFADALDDYLRINNLIPDDFKRLYDLHAIMQKLDLFSKEKSGHAKMLDLLVTKIEKMPLPLREKYSWNLLSGFYYSDDDEMRKLNRKYKDIDFPLIRNRLLEIYSDAVAERLGRDDDSYEYFSKIQKLSEFIDQEHSDGIYENSERIGINKVTKGKLYRLISDKIQSQERVSKFLANDKNVVLSDANAQTGDLLGRPTEALLELLERHEELCVYSIEFLNRKLTTKSISEYRTKCDKYIDLFLNVKELLTPAVLENFYHTFWSSGLEVRALIMNKLLNRAFKTLDEKIKYVCDMNFDKDNKYRKDAEMICDCVIKSFQPYEQGLILAAVASADENKQEGQTASRSVGEGLRMFFENMGPAWVKFGQLLSYVPDLPSEIRRDLAKLKDRADMPARWDVYTWLHEAMPQDLYNRIERVDDIVGAGSFWMTAIVQLRNDKGGLEKKVVQLLRPNAGSRADSGFKTIELAIKKLAKRNSSYQILQEVARQAHESAKYEVDVEIGNKQYEKAKELYGDIQVNVEGIQYTPHVADWRYYGTGKNGMSYKIMDYAEGATLSRVYASDDERRKMALAYFAIEMVNLFKGDVWDIDRHQGQQNFDITSPTNVSINIYDTGAQLPKAPNKKNKILLANIFFDLIQEVQAGKSIDAYLLKVIKRLDKLQNTLHIDVSYVSNVQKGLMALSDIIEYQKEIKDADGNIIQKRLTLSAEDLKHAIVAVLQNPSVDEHMGVVIKGRVVASKLKHMDIQALKELLQNSGDTSDNPVKIEIAENVYEKLSAKLNKATEEIEALDNPEDSIMGIPTQYIDSKESKPPMPDFDIYQKVA